MGQFRIVIEAQGPHGCSRDVVDGGTVYGCGNMRCPDCRTREFIERLKETGSIIQTAVLTHWPDTAYTVSDDLLTKKRSGTFPK